MLTLLRASAKANKWEPHFVHRAKRVAASWTTHWLAENGVEYGAVPVKAFWYAEEKPTPEARECSRLSRPQATPAESWYAALPPLGPDEPVGLYFHGGGYIAGTAAETDIIAAVPKHLATHSPVHRILSVDYRLAPQGPWPLPLMDAISAYHYLLTLGIAHENIVVFGDSAGGHLAMALTRWLRDDGVHVGMGLPRGLVLLSPWSDLGFTDVWGDGQTFNIDSDLVSRFGCFFRSNPFLGDSSFELTVWNAQIHDSFGPFACSLLMRALPVSLVHTSPYISPASLLIPPSAQGEISMEGFPPTCIVYGGAERIGRSIKELWSRLCLSRNSHQVQSTADMLIEGKDCIHDFMIFSWQIRPAAQVYAKINDWLGRLLTTPLTPKANKSGTREKLVAQVEGLSESFDAENSPVMVPSWSRMAEAKELDELTLVDSAWSDIYTSSAAERAEAVPRGPTQYDRGLPILCKGDQQIGNEGKLEHMHDGTRPAADCVGDDLISVVYG